jgi:hypothetical protein
MVWATLGLGSLTCKKERWNSTRSTSTFRKKARTSFDASIKFALDFLGAIEAL